MLTATFFILFQSLEIYTFHSIHYIFPLFTVWPLLYTVNAVGFANKKCICLENLKLFFSGYCEITFCFDSLLTIRLSSLDVFRVVTIIILFILKCEETLRSRVNSDLPFLGFQTSVFVNWSDTPSFVKTRRPPLRFKVERRSPSKRLWNDL